MEVNDRLCRMLGYTREELVGKNARMLYADPQEFERVDREKYAQMEKEDAGVLETVWKRKDGRLLPVLLSFAPVDPRQPQGDFTFTALDITLRRQAQEDARRSEALYRQLFETMLEGVVYQDAEGKIFSANPSAERILGLTLDQMTGRTSMDPRWRAVREDGSDFPGEEHPAMLALRSGKPVQGLVMGVFNPVMNETRWIRVNSIPLFHPGEEKPYQVYSIFNDITEAYQLAKDVKAAVILRRKEQG